MDIPPDYCRTKDDVRNFELRRIANLLEKLLVAVEHMPYSKQPMSVLQNPEDQKTVSVQRSLTGLL